MEKTVFLFKRKKERSRADFARHYINSHAPLGARLTRCLLGYTVNIVESAGGPDAVTEHWLPAAMDLLTPEKAYASDADFKAVLADDRTLFEGIPELHVAVDETCLVPGDPLDTPVGEATSGTKLILLYPDAGAAPAPPPAARRVVDNRVGYKLVFGASGRERVRSEFELIRMAWMPPGDAALTVPSDALVVREYRFIPAPRWERDSHRQREFQPRISTP